MTSENCGCSFGSYMVPQVGQYFAAIERCKGNFFWRRVLSREEERSPYRTLIQLEREYHAICDAKLSGHAGTDTDERLQELAQILESFWPDSIQQDELAVQLKEKEEATYKDLVEIRKAIEEVSRKVRKYEGQRGEG